MAETIHHMSLHIFLKGIKTGVIGVIRFPFLLPDYIASVPKYAQSYVRFLKHQICETFIKY